jgi:hypothetical protein
MKLQIPALPPILAGSDIFAWRKWFAFWSLPLEYKADIVDRFPSLVIERLPPPESACGMGIVGMRQVNTHVYFDPAVFDTQVSCAVVFNAYDHISYAETYPMQSYPDLVFGVPVKELLFLGLTAMNFSVLAYKFRYQIRPENFYFGTDYELALLDVTTEAELATFYGSGPR